MKYRDTHFLYVIAILALVGISAVFVGYATDTLPKNTTKKVSMSTYEGTTPLVNKDPCGCCAERREQIRQFIQQTQSRIEKQIIEISSTATQRQQPLSNTSSPQ